VGRRAQVSAVALFAAASCLVSTAATAGAAPSPHRDALRAVVVASGLASPTGFTFGPGGVIVYGERFTGRIRFYDPATGSDHVVYRIPNVDGSFDRGLLGVALHPRYPDIPFVYAYVTRHTPSGSRNELLRVTNDHGHGTDPKVLFSLPAGPEHQGGRIEFGPDGMLYVVVGEGMNRAASQDLSSLRGKILRMTPWGAPAPGNPFPHSRVWSYGHRNSFGFAFDQLSANLWETENGPHCNDELNRIVAGGNYAWGPHEEEDCSPAMPGALETNRDGPAPRRQPEAWWTPTIAPTGIAFCDQCGLGTAYQGTALMSDFNRSELIRIRLTADRLHVASQQVVFHAEFVTSIEVGPDHAIYLSRPHAIERLELG